MKRFLLVMIVSAVLGPCATLAADSPVGKWKTTDAKTGAVVSEIQIYEEGGKLFGKITSLTEPNNKEGKPKTCTACTGGDKDKPIIGLVIVKDLSASGKSYKGGTILDPEDGKVYLGPVYKTQTWIK